MADQYDSLMGHLRRVVNIRYGSACSQHDRASWSPAVVYLTLSRLGASFVLYALPLVRCCSDLTYRTRSVDPLVAGTAPCDPHDPLTRHCPDLDTVYVCLCFL